jgi:hypothetical protein
VYSKEKLFSFEKKITTFNTLFIFYNYKLDKYAFVEIVLLKIKLSSNLKTS